MEYVCANDWVCAYVCEIISMYTFIGKRTRWEWVMLCAYLCLLWFALCMYACVSLCPRACVRVWCARGFVLFSGCSVIHLRVCLQPFCSGAWNLGYHGSNCQLWPSPLLFQFSSLFRVSEKDSASRRLSLKPFTLFLLLYSFTLSFYWLWQLCGIAHAAPSAGRYRTNFCTKHYRDPSNSAHRVWKLCSNSRFGCLQLAQTALKGAIQRAGVRCVTHHVWTCGLDSGECRVS